ncbi:MAG: presenilin family intramembrane aspartyl protease [archaeon]
MKHNLKVTFILLAMFLVTQFIGLYVVNHYQQTVSLPYGMQPPSIEEEKDYFSFFPTIVIAFIIAISLFFLLTKFKFETVIKIWFFIVVVIALGITLTAIFPSFKYSSLIALAIALPLAVIKVFKRNFLTHNLTELFIYPGIAAVFVPIFNIYTIILLLILISIYDVWAVWHSGIMQKMAKYHIDKLNIFPGFFVPYASKKIKEKIKFMKKTLSEKELKNKKIKINIALLGGGDIIFPIITAGVFMRTFGFAQSLFVIAGAALGLSYLFFFAEKKKFYPAMPFITTGIFLGMLISWIIF